jgi:hypothetical protein
MTEIMEAVAARKALEKALAPKASGPLSDLTIADAAAKSGLPLRDAERGMHALLSEYRGHLRVTNDGDLVFRFPTGFSKPWETRDRLASAAAAIGRGAVGVARFVVRAWIAVVLVGYAALFLALLLAQVFVAQGERRERSDGIGSGVAFVLWRVVFDAFFWTFHPFSPFAYGSYGGYRDDRVAYARGRREPKTPFYEKVNRFFFGPTEAPSDPRETERRILAEIRAQKGRIGLADVIRVTGLPRDQADPMMSRLMLDYDGSVEVSEEGGITYRFANLRKTALSEEKGSPPPVWSRVERLPPLTGNDDGANAIIVGLNGFNLVMSVYALNHGLTLHRLAYLFHGIPERRIPMDGTAIALGIVPLVFSIALFLLPLGRALYRTRKARLIARENGRRAILREILEKVGNRRPVTDVDLTRAWTKAAGEPPPERAITREVVGLGGDVDLEGGAKIRYRFPDLETEAKALEAEREAASEEEARLGKVVFTSDD